MTDEDIKEFVGYTYGRQVEHAVYSIIRMGFPDIEKLEVELKDGMINIQFAADKYNGQEVLDYMEKVKKECSR